MKKRTKETVDNPILKIDHKMDEGDEQSVDSRALDWFVLRLSLYSHCKNIEKDSVHIKKVIQYACRTKKNPLSSAEEEKETFISTMVYEKDGDYCRKFKTDLSPDFVAKVFGYIREDIKRACVFLGDFAGGPSKESIRECYRVDNKGICTREEIEYQRRFWAESFLRNGNKDMRDWYSWFHASITPFSLSSELSGIRNWIHCYLPQNAEIFDKRIWETIQKHEQFTRQLMYPQNTSLPTYSEFGENRDTLHGIITFLPFMETMILGAKVSLPAKSIQNEYDKRTDPWGTPEPLLHLAGTLQRAGKVMTTGDLLRLGIDPSQILSLSKGKCTQQDREWAEKHLKAGRGRWKWNPPKLPSEK